jgi:hypothetical protein
MKTFRPKKLKRTCSPNYLWEWVTMFPFFFHLYTQKLIHRNLVRYEIIRTLKQNCVNTYTKLITFLILLVVTFCIPYGLTPNILRSAYVFYLHFLYGSRKERRFFPPYKILIDRILQYSRSVFFAKRMWTNIQVSTNFHALYSVAGSIRLRTLTKIEVQKMCT